MRVSVGVSLQGSKEQELRSVHIIVPCATIGIMFVLIGFALAANSYREIGTPCPDDMSTVPELGPSTPDRPFLEAGPASDWVLVPVPAWEQVPGFSLCLPPGWKFKERTGIDSYIGEFVGHNMVLWFDYGAYSSSLNYGPGHEPEYHVAYEYVGRAYAKLVLPRDGRVGTTGIHFADLGRVRLTVYGKNLSRFQQRTAFAVFRSIREGTD